MKNIRWILQTASDKIRYRNTEIISAAVVLPRHSIDEDRNHGMNKSRIRRMAFFAVLCIILTVYFPVPAHAGNDREQLPFESNHMAQYYDVSTGYPVSEANDAAQTTDGFMYLACYGGLLRFDGTDFVRIPAISNAVSLYSEEDGGLWVGTNDSGLAYMSPEWEFTFYGLESGLPGLSVRGIEKDSRGNLLLATSGGLCLRDKETGAITQIGAEEIQGQLVYNLTEDYGSGFWCMIGDDNIGCWRQDGTFEMWNARDLGFLPQCVVPDRENPGYIYIGTKKDDIRYGKVGEDFFTFKTIRVPDIGSINNVCNVDGRIWILGEYGIAYRDANGFCHMLEYVPLHTSVHTLTADYEGNLWFTSTRKGVMKLSRSIFADITGIAGMEKNVVNTTCLKENRLYIGTDSGLEVLDSSYKPVHSPAKAYLKSGRVRAIKEDSRGNLWFCSYNSKNALVKMDPNGRITVFNEENGLPNNYCRTMLELQDGSIAAATTGGIALLRDDRVVEVITPENGLCRATILCMAEDDEGRLFLGSDGDGIYVLEHGAVGPYENDSPTTSGVILNMRKDAKRDCFWIVTSDSGYCMKDGVIREIPKFPVGGTSGSGFDVLPADNGQIWILSGNGVFVCDGDRLLAGEETVISFYDTQRGLPHIPTANARSCLLPDGRAFLAGTDGVTLVDISDRLDEYGSMKLAVPYVGIDGRLVRVAPGEVLRVNADTTRITFYGYALTYALRNPQLEYELQGFDDNGTDIPMDDLSPVSYTNLHGGTYTFRLALKNPEESGVRDQVEVKIVKEKAFYEQPLFWLVALIALGLAIRKSTDYELARQKRKLAKQQEEERIGAELSMAASIQSNCLPSDFPAFPDREEFDVFASMKPAKEVGGDLYDFFLIDEDHLGLAIADVSGKGVPAALYMMVLKVLVENCTVNHASPAQALADMNEQICRNNPEEMFVTAWLGILNLKTGLLTASNAGHEYPMFRKPDGAFELVRDKHGFVLGGMEGSRYRDYEMQMEPGATLFVYTDGVAEATNVKKEQFGTGRTLQALNRNPENTPEGLVWEVSAAISDFIKDEPQFDDITMLCLHYKGSEKS